MAWLDYEAIFQHWEKVLAIPQIQLIIIENRSRYTEKIIQPAALEMMRNNNSLLGYYSFEKNIGKDALAAVLDLHLNLIAASPFVLITDSDVVPLDNNWLDEEIRIMTKYPDCGSCRIQFDFSELPLRTVPDSSEWQKRMGGKELEDCFETHMGGYLVLMRGPLLAEMLREVKSKNLEFLDVTFHQFLRQRKMRMLTTKKSRFKHYSWVRFQKMTHPACTLKLSSNRLDIWHKKRSCSFWEYRRGENPIYHEREAVGGSVFGNEHGE